MAHIKSVFIAGASGFIGRALIPRLTAEGWRVTALVRSGSQSKVPGECKVVVGDPLNPDTYHAHVEPGSAFVQLVGVNHPAPFSGHQFRKIDLTAGLTSVQVAQDKNVSHFVYLSVVQPAPFMKSFQNVRAEVEKKLTESGLKVSVFRPWYVLGPGRMWPIIFKPLYWMLGRWSATRSTARRLGFVHRDDMVASMMAALHRPPPGVKIWDVPAIRKRRI